MHSTTLDNGTRAISQLERQTMRKVAWRLLPILMLGYFIAFVDRVNVGFAALQMNHAVGIDHAAFGLGGGLFYLTYVLFEIPSNLAMQKVGARLWIARIMISWAWCPPVPPSSPVRTRSTRCGSCSAPRKPASSRA